MVGKIFLVFIVSFITHATVIGCDCKWDQTDEQQYCAFDFVFRGTVFKKQELGDLLNPDDAELKYSLNVTKIFKGNKFFNSTDEFTVSTAILVSRCGVHLSDKTDYLIGGFVSDNQAKLNSCDWVRRWPKEVSLSISKILLGKSISCK